MYLDHYGLSAAPFRITPDTDVFFAGANRGLTLDAMVYAITHDEGIVKVSGGVGSGKTMMCRMLMERLPPHVVIVYLANPSLSRDDILYAIADELKISAPALPSSAMLRILHEHLIKLFEDGRQVVVLIDEAQAMPIETLEEIRLLSNLESPRHKLLQLVLFGQPELNAILARPEMRQLKERITHHFTLEPLQRRDVAEYLSFRLRAAGYRGPEIFGTAAVKRITDASLGMTRRINILADKSLLAAFADNTHQIAPRHVRAAIRDSEFRPDHHRRVKFAFALGAIALATVALGLLLPKAGEHRQEPQPVVTDDNVSITPLQSPIAPPLPATTATAPAQANPPVPAAANPLLLGKQTLARIEATHQWLAKTGDDRWFIQLLTADISSAGKIEDFVANAIRQADENQVHVYIVKINGTQRVGVIYGDYPSSEAALAAAKQFPESLRTLEPFPRMVKRLR